MNRRLLYALFLLLCCALLTGMTMPDAPRPQRHEKSRVQTYVEEHSSTEQEKRQAGKSVKVRKPPSDAAKNAQSLENPATRKQSRSVDRSPRTVLPSRSLR